MLEREKVADVELLLQGEGSSVETTATIIVEPGPSSGTGKPALRAVVVVGQQQQQQQARWEKWRRPLAGVVFHLLAALLVLFLSVHFIPSTPVETTLLRDMLRNDQFDWPGLALWQFLLLEGFAFVAQITERRPNPFHSRRGGYKARRLSKTGHLWCDYSE